MEDDFYDVVLQDGYFKWLCGIIGFRNIEYSTCRHCLLLIYLFDTEFYILDNIEGNEKNRLMDAMDLKVEFCETHPEIDRDSMFKNPPSVLEVMVALARRIDDDIMYDPRVGLNASQWFWEMVRNLGMDSFTDDNYNFTWASDDVGIILDRMMDRAYDRNGIGSLFPLKNPSFDARNVEIWMQMQAWLSENYG